MTVTDRFRHEAYLYEGEDDFAAGAVPFIRDGVSRSEPVLVAVDKRKIARLRGELGADAERVQFADMREVGRNPGRIIPIWREFVREHTVDGKRVRGIGEPVWAGRSEAELVECRHHESLLNLVFDQGAPWWLLCPYDAAILDNGSLEAARENHPFCTEHGRSNASEQYVDPLHGPSPLEAPLHTPAEDAEEVAFDLEGLSPMRTLVGARAAAAGLSGRRIADLVVAVNELATNSIRHGRGTGRLRIWCEGGSLFCEVSDGGRIAQPLVGRDRPAREQTSGRGLWLVHQLCDLVQLRSGSDGTLARVEMERR